VESIHYHLELTPEQLKITHTALRSLLDDFGHEEQEIVGLIHEVLAKLPDEHAIRAIRIEVESGAEPGADAGVTEPTQLPEPPTGGSPSAA
jgi:hypothetical protein